MKISKAKRGDIVQCNRGGQIFHAVVTDYHREGNRNTRLEVEPIQRGVSYRQVSAREVIGHWRRMSG